MIFVDSSIWIDFFNGRMTPRVDALDRLLGEELIVVGDLIYVEVLQGFRNERDFNAALNTFNSLTCQDMLGKDIAIQSTRNYRFLRKRGITIRKTIDIIIGTFCIENDLILLHDDRDFEPLERFLGLKTYVC